MRMHRYRGKENGLMVIGSLSELRALSEAIRAITENMPQPRVHGWPVEVASTSIVAADGFLLSLHLEEEGGVEPKSNFPRTGWFT